MIWQKRCFRSQVGGTTTEERGHYSYTAKSKANELYPGQHRCSSQTEWAKCLRRRPRPRRFVQQFDFQFGRSDLITSVGHGPTGIDTAHSPVSVSVTPTLAEKGNPPAKGGETGTRHGKTSTQAAMSSLANKVTATDKSRDCLVWDVTKNVWQQWCLIPTNRWFFSFWCQARASAPG